MGKNNKSTSDSAITRRILPVDALTEILARLPVISLLKFSCVSKPWKSLISSRDFSKAHERHSNLKHVVMLSENKREFKYFSIHCALNEPLVRVLSANHVKRFRVCREIKLYVPDQIRVTTFVGSCHGLICIALTGNDVVLWNPSTRRSKLLPDFGNEYGYSIYRSYGFGYDESSDDYKVVGFYFGLKYKSDVLVKIYSLKTGKLKKLQNHRGCWMVERPPTFANGKIHWFVRSEVGEENWKPQLPQHDWGIAYLNLETEKYGMLKKPHSVEFGWGSCMTALPGGSFCVACNFFDSTKVWLAEPDYGVGTTNWTEYDHLNISSKYLTPPTVLENGDIVLVSDGKIMILNPIYRSVRYPERRNSPREFSEGIAYVESLVSPY